MAYLPKIRQQLPCGNMGCAISEEFAVLLIPRSSFAKAVVQFGQIGLQAVFCGFADSPL